MSACDMFLMDEVTDDDGNDLFTHRCKNHELYEYTDDGSLDQCRIGVSESELESAKQESQALKDEAAVLKEGIAELKILVKHMWNERVYCDLGKVRMTLEQKDLLSDTLKKSEVKS